MISQKKIMAKTKDIHRSSKTGKFVKPNYAKNHPSTTEKEKVKIGKK